MSMGKATVENSIEVPQKIKNWITIWFSKPLLGIYPKELKLHSPGDISIPVFVAALFTITKTGKQPKCPLMDEWINIWYIHIMECCVLCVHVIYVYNVYNDDAVWNAIGLFFNEWQSIFYPVIRIELVAF